MTDNRPYFIARIVDGRPETRGKARAEFGHRIKLVSGAEDDGVFAYWHWDGNRLVAGNDRYGFCPLFWSRIGNDGVAISPSIPRLVELGSPTELDIDALSVFFRLGYFVGDDTPFAAIRALPPNADFFWSGGNLECRAKYPSVPRLSNISRNDAIDTYIALFEQAVARRLPPDNEFIVPASGGKDSRHILFELHRTGLTPSTCVSEKDPPPDPNQDPEVAAYLCKELGFKHLTIQNEMSVFSAQLRKTKEVSFCEVPDGWYLPVRDFLEKQQCRCIFDGIGGDVLSQSSFLSPEMDAVFRSEKVDSVCRAFLTQYGGSDTVLRKLLRGALESAVQQNVAVSRLSREMEKHLGAHNPIASFVFWNRTRRKIAMGPYGLLQKLPYVYAPYLDHDLYNFLTTLPSSLLMDGRFHTEAIERAYPNFTDIPYADHKSAQWVDDRRIRAQYLAEASHSFMLKRPSSLISTVPLRAKMMISILSRGYVNPWLSPLVIYLDQLESIITMSRQ